MNSGSPTAQRPSAHCFEVTPQLSIQPPLSRRGNGPGLVLVVSAALDLSRHDKTLDPPPLRKWAEEGYAVAQILVNDGVADVAGQLGTAVAELEKLPECSGDNFGLVGMDAFSPTRCCWGALASLTGAKNESDNRRERDG